jgi:hypothetical protein
LEPDRKTSSAKNDVLTVTIPFTGSAHSLQLCPSGGTTGVSHVADVDPNGAVVLQVLDDTQAAHEVRTFVDAVTRNLDLLRAEYYAFTAQLMSAVFAAAAQRQKEITAEDARDDAHDISAAPK